MLLRARRFWGALLLAALVACPTTMVEAASKSRPKTQTTVQKSKRSRTTVRRKSTRRKKRGTRRRVAREPRLPRGSVVFARSALIMDPTTDQVLYEKNAARTVPIASLTKLMTALVFLDQKPDLRRDVEVTRAELRGGGQTQLRNHEKVALYDLLHMSLMNSDNVATRVLARESGLSHPEFVRRMNERADRLDMEHSRFVETTGLDERNVSSAHDLVILLREAADHYLVREITSTPTYVFTSASPVRHHQIVNTNRLLRSGRYEVNCGKTGFISEAGYCVVTWIRTKGRDLIAVVLGAPTNATRFADVVRLVNRTEALSAQAQAN